MLAARACHRWAGGQHLKFWRSSLRSARHLSHGRKWQHQGRGTVLNSAASQSRKSVVFFGTPQVAVPVLDGLIQAASQPDSTFDVTGVVSQPARPSGRGSRRNPPPSPVAQAAARAGIPQDRILTPERAGDAGFLDALRSLHPDLLVTAAYGNYLPTRLLGIPRQGTLNIHPSLLPAYRGAAPVQRALMDGLTQTGVSVLYSVREMDAGPVLAQAAYEIPEDVQAPELTQRLFELGTRLLLDALPDVWAGMGPSLALPQDAATATAAPKLSSADAALDLGLPAAAVHARVRACAGWPGSSVAFLVRDPAGRESALTLKVLRTRLAESSGPGTEVQNTSQEPNQVELAPGALTVRCGDGGRLSILELQVPGRRPVSPAAFINGLRGATLSWVPIR
ncbi:MTF1 [Auxenochlorella protothecoides x Auxenochlorella symbiontica]|uniref:Methionyl-tRNA formyltransferase, mitochondrial n=1 Tax=Auxenochlorella protothecoides TaxID=3075 RepID=A0A1D2A5E0_AUXPR